MITTLATPSIAESMPKPISAIEPAAIPAAIAIPPSRLIQTRLSQESAFALRAALSHSCDRAGAAAASRWTDDQLGHAADVLGERRREQRAPRAR